MNDASEQIRLLKERFEALTSQVMEIRRQLEGMNARSRTTCDSGTLTVRADGCLEMRRNFEDAKREIEHLRAGSQISTLPVSNLQTEKQAAHAEIYRDHMPDVTVGQCIWMKQGVDDTPRRLLCTAMDDSMLIFDEVDSEGTLLA